MSKVQFVVTFDDTKHELNEAGLSDLVAFEKHFGLPSSVLNVETKVVVNDETGLVELDEDGEPKKEIVGTFMLEWICFLLYRQLRKISVIAKDLPFDEDFIDRISDVSKPENSDAEVTTEDPTSPDSTHTG